MPTLGRFALKLGLVIAGLAVGAVAAAAAYNAFDEDLSEQAQALLKPGPVGKVDDGNAYVLFLGMAAPPGQDQAAWGRKAAAAYTAQMQPGFLATEEWKNATRPHIKVERMLWCKPDCVQEVRRDTAAVSARLAANAELLARYRATRDAPGFSEIDTSGLLLASPSYNLLIAGALLSMSDTAAKAGASDTGALITGFEREVKFHRRLVTEGTTLLTVMVGQDLLARDLLALSALSTRFNAADAGGLARIHAMAGPEIGGAGLQAAFRQTSRENVAFARGWKQLLRDNSASAQAEYLAFPVASWWMSFFIRPNGTANRVAAAMTAQEPLATVPAAQFDREQAAAVQSRQAMLERPWYAEANNPVGKDAAEFMVPALEKYAARTNDLRALARMVDLQATLAERSISEPAAVAAFVAGDGAKSHPDPYTGKAFAFDAATRQLSFQPRGSSRWIDEMKKGQAGKVAVRL